MHALRFISTYLPPLDRATLPMEYGIFYHLTSVPVTRLINDGEMQRNNIFAVIYLYRVYMRGAYDPSAASEICNFIA